MSDLNIEQVRKDHAALCDDLAKFQAKMTEGGTLTQSEGETAEQKAKEAQRLQGILDAHDARQETIRAAMDGGRKAQERANRLQPFDLPADSHEATEAKASNRVAGYMTLGNFIATREAARDYVKQYPNGVPVGVQYELGKLENASLLGRKSDALVPLTKGQIDALHETKAVPTLGEEVIIPTRVPEVRRVNEFDRLRLRDVLDISSTQSDSVRYVRVTYNTDGSRASAATAHGSAKPETTMEFDTVTETVRTIAVWIPVHNQQLADYGQLRSIIDNHLIYDVEREVENLILYGSGTGEEFEGIVTDTAVQAARTGVTADDTNLDLIRGMITDVRVANYEPNGILMHPQDFEGIVLEKGTDDHYVWAMVQDGNLRRVWGVPVVETNAAEDDDGERNIIVGDWLRGATLWDRMQTTVMVGWINAQFTSNQRTILAEQRAAFGVTRPAAFRKLNTQAATSS